MTDLPTTTRSNVAAGNTRAVQVRNHGLPADWWLHDECWAALEKLSSRMSGSTLVPNDFRQAPGNCFVALMAGLPLGLSPLACLQSIAVINGRPTLWGDAPIAQVLAHPSLVKHYERVEGTIAAGDRKWTFGVVRRLPSGEQVQTERSFSIDDAKLAKLWGKTGSSGQPTPWVTAPDRMLFNRARAFTLRDAFSDVLKGVQLAADTFDDGDAPVPATFTVRDDGPARAVAAVTADGFGDEPAPPPAAEAEKPKRGKAAKKAAAATGPEPAAAEPEPAAAEAATTSDAEPETPAAKPFPAWARRADLAGLVATIDDDGLPRRVLLQLEPWRGNKDIPEGRGGDLLVRFLPGADHVPQLFVHAGNLWRPDDEPENFEAACQGFVAAIHAQLRELGREPEAPDTDRMLRDICEGVECIGPMDANEPVLDVLNLRGLHLLRAQLAQTVETAKRGRGGK